MYHTNQTIYIWNFLVLHTKTICTQVINRLLGIIGTDPGGGPGPKKNF